MKNNFLKIGFLIGCLIFIQIISCENKKPTEKSLTFTEEDHDYTADNETKKIDHIQFTDVTVEAGIQFEHITGAFGKKWMPETVGSGGGFLDYNNDERIDVFLVNSCEWEGHKSGNVKSSPKLFRNDGNNSFVDVTVESGLNDISIYGMGASFADYDADGDLDIYMTAVGTNKLLRNDQGRFTDVAVEMKVTGNDPDMGKAPAWSTSSAWVDVDRDGWLDLFVANYVKWTPATDIYTTRDGKTKSYATPDVYEGESCRLYRNMQGKSFEDITVNAGVLNNEGKSLGVAIEDFNNDRWPDIVISNDTQPNFLYMNNGDGTFKNMAIPAGIAYDENGRARAGMGIDVADIANDNKLAIVIGNFSQEPLSLYTQTNHANLFLDRAGAAKLTKATLLQLTFGLLFVDLDLDCYADLITANGHIEPEINAVQKDITFTQKPQLFFNDQGKYIDITEQAGPPFLEEIVGRGVASGDIDKDGDLDVLITVNGGTPKLLRNDTRTDNKSLKVVLKGKSPNRYAIGAKVAVWTNGMKQQKMMRTGSSFLTQSDIGSLVFGLGDHHLADSLIVFWPTTGAKKLIANVSSGEIQVEED